MNTITLSAIAQINEVHPSLTPNMKPKWTRRDLNEEVEQFILVSNPFLAEDGDEDELFDELVHLIS
ncbi:hypothetical protein [Cohnella sp. GCM10027633]|uniref:hypothetical protein n=1 Tax=unclassified Cohnella TaxID=2636738 RepID=UPI0036429D26